PAVLFPIGTAFAQCVQPGNESHESNEPYNTEHARQTDGQTCDITTVNQVKKPSYTFCVDDIVYSGLTYNAAENVVTCSSY
ncbi:MAG: hypothetical protein OEV87_13200, partial [Phycisphaerae bacterium]|nr:hypothetical protein [Phycisphaerae bacterium]